MEQVKRKKLNKPEQEIIPNDDCLEMSESRKSPKRNSLYIPIIPAPKTPVRNRPNRNSAPFASPFKIQPIAKEVLSDEQLSKLYTETISLAAAGKITQKNTWTINLIDHIDDLLSREKKEVEAKITKSSTLFRKASNTLDASIKIYSSRVDSVHSQMYKVLGGLNQNNRSDKNEESDPEVKEENKDGEKKKKKKLNSLDPSETLLSNNKLQSVCLSQNDFSYEIDPMFFKMASAFDEGGVRGLLLTNLEVGADLQIIFDSELPLEKNMSLSAEKNQNTKMKDIDHNSHEGVTKTDEFEKMLGEVSSFLENVKLCPLLKAFQNEYNSVKREIAVLRGEDVSKVDDVSENDIYGIDEAFGKELINQPTFNDNEDGGLENNMDGEESEERDSENRVETEKRKTLEGSQTISEVCPVFSFKDEGGKESKERENPEWESSSSSKTKFLNWAGPNYWHLNRKKFKEKVEKEKDNKNNNKKQNNKKEEQLIDFNSLLNESTPTEKEDKMGDKNKNTKRKRAKTKKEVYNTLPEDMHLTPDLFLRPFYRPELMARFEKRKTVPGETAGGNEDAPVDVRWFDYENPRDLGYVADVGGQESAGESDHVLDSELAAEGEAEAFTQSALGEFGAVGSQTVQEGENLESFAFSNISKQVDVKRLKDGLWSALSSGAKRNTAAGAEKTPGESPAGAAEAKRKDERAAAEGSSDGKVSFLDSVKYLKEKNREMRFASMQYCFVCLLHLANENELEMAQGEKLGDFSVFSKNKFV